jgi:hypothetical protein
MTTLADADADANANACKRQRKGKQMANECEMQKYNGRTTSVYATDYAKKEKHRD